MKNGYLSEGTTRDIDRQVAKVLRGLGNPKPPLCIEDVVELLKLDRQFYSSTNDGALRETYSRIRVGVLQVLKRPTLILDAVKKADLRAFYLPDRKRILIDEERVPTLKVRWTTAHEVTHHLCIEWHGDVLFGDTELTLNESCHEQIEREANYGAGRLLTLQQDMSEQLEGEAFSMKNVQKLADLYKNTIVSTLWRAVEQSNIPAFAVIGRHPKHIRAAVAAGKDVYCEWPLTPTAAKSAELARLADAAGVKTQIGLQRQFAPAFRYVHDLIAQGYVGKVRSARMHVSVNMFGEIRTKAARWSLPVENLGIGEQRNRKLA